MTTSSATLTQKIIAAAGHPRAEKIMALISFAESSVFPIPPDVMLAPMVIARPERYLRLALVCTLASVLGGVLGYIIGAFFYDVVGAPIIEFYGYEEAYESLKKKYLELGFMLVLIAGFTPLPYKVFTIASGVFAFNPLVFIVGSLISRGARYFLVCWIFHRLGPSATKLMERYGSLFMISAFILIIVGFFALKML